MVQMSLKTLVRDVRVAMDENMTDDGLQLLRDVNTLTLDEVVKHQVEPAAHLVLLGADVELLDGGQSFVGSSVSRLSNNVGRVKLPEDYLRFLFFKMSNWDYGVNTFITPNDERYPQMFSRWVGASVHRPTIALVPSDGGMSVEFFTAGGNVEEARYVAKPRLLQADKDCSISFPPLLGGALVHMTAALSCQKLGQMPEASVLSSVAKGLMSSRPSYKPPSNVNMPLVQSQQQEGAATEDEAES